jgi:anti-sigma factor RsiW
MASTIEQKISELVDGELDATEREQVYKQLKSVGHHQKVWSRYCMISDALKKTLPDNPKHDLSLRIKAALESEPSYLVPTASTSATTTEKDIERNKGYALPAAAFAGAEERSGFRFGFGMAAAASVAVVSVVGMLMLGESPEPVSLDAQLESAPVLANSSNSPAANSSPVQIVNTPPNLVLVNPGQALVPNGQWDRLPSSNVVNLEKFLIEHSETSSQNAVSPGMFPYARVVGFEAGESK